MIQLGSEARINIHWKVSPFDFSKESMNSLISKTSKKYNIPKEHVRITPVFQTKDNDGNTISLTTDITSDIQDPVFQEKLFKDYLKLNNIDNCDFDVIKKIDSEINGKIDYKVYDKYRKFTIKWLKWSNFLSYGGDNVFDFRNLHGIVLLNGDNQSGKTTFAIDLIHFLLFGKTEKVPTQDKIFNKHLPEETKVEVEGCLNIEGEDYIIKRTLSRPSLDKRSARSKTTQKVEYYKIVGSDKEELTEYIENQQEENSAQTNKKIKEAIGREDDFDLMMSITEANLDALIDKKDTERGRLLSRWIGLLPLEEKDALAREHFNQSIKPYLVSNQYNSEDIKNEIGAYNVSIKQSLQSIKDYQKLNDKVEEELKNYEQMGKVLLSSKEKIDDNLLKIDITTLNASIDRITNEGKTKAAECKTVSEEINAIGDIDFSVEEYDNLVDRLNKLSGDKAKYAEQYKSLKHNIEHLQKSEYCPTCGRKLDGVDNSEKINELSENLKKVVANGQDTANRILEVSTQIEKEKTKREEYNKKNILLMKESALKMSIEKLRNKLKDLLQKRKDYLKNAEAIDKNNNLDIQIRNNEIIIADKRKAKENNLEWISQNKAKIEEFRERINERETILAKIKEETELVRNWKIYLDMVGKNGISKMVLRKTLPIINARLAQLLSDVCDFDVEVVINNKNDVSFNLIKDGVVSDLSSGSGFERTCASLALRFVLADISSISKANFTLLDEVLGRVAKDNIENIHKLFEKILGSYDFILHVCHLDEAKDWSKTQIYVSKTNNISHIKIEENANVK